MLWCVCLPARGESSRGEDAIARACKRESTSCASVCARAWVIARAAYSSTSLSSIYRISFALTHTHTRARYYHVYKYGIYTRLLSLLTIARARTINMRALCGFGFWAALVLVRYIIHTHFVFLPPKGARARCAMVPRCCLCEEVFLFSPHTIYIYVENVRHKRNRKQNKSAHWCTLCVVPCDQRVCWYLYFFCVFLWR